MLADMVFLFVSFDKYPLFPLRPFITVKYRWIAWSCIVSWRSSGVARFCRGVNVLKQLS